jgi:hypothetical protein
MMLWLVRVFINLIMRLCLHGLCFVHRLALGFSHQPTKTGENFFSRYYWLTTTSRGKNPLYTDSRWQLLSRWSTLRNWERAKCAEMKISPSLSHLEMSQPMGLWHWTLGNKIPWLLLILMLPRLRWLIYYFNWKREALIKRKLLDGMQLISIKAHHL